MKPKILLLQARDATDPMKAHELECFREKTKLPAESFVTHDLTEGAPTISQARACDALMVGGSGDYYVSKRNLPQFERSLDFLREIAEIGHPTFASCFGYQCLVQALGGEVVHDPERMEIGTYEVELTDRGREDPVFGALPPRFFAQFGHKDRAAVQPPGVPNLASSERNPFQAFRLPGKPVWATQFHPELDHRSNRDRLENYLAGYAAHMSEEETREAFARHRESPEASELLGRFLKLVFD